MKRLILTVAFLFLASPAFAAIAHDATTVGLHPNNQSVSSPGTSHTAGTLTNGIAMIYVSWQDSPGVLNSVTYCGNAATILTGSPRATSAGGRFAEIWYYLSPPSGACAVIATFSEVVNEHIISVSTYSGVSQSAPFNTVPTPVANFDTVNPSEAQITITSAVGEVAVALTTWPVATPTTTDTSRASVTADVQFQGVSEKAGAAGSVTMSWTVASSLESGILGVSLKPASTRRAVAPVLLQ